MDQPTIQDRFEPIKPNPYVVGNPVRDRTMFFGREADFDVVRRRFTDSQHGGLLVFGGERRSGKTSILFQIQDGRLGEDFIPVLVDMQSMAIESERDFLSRISAEILKSVTPNAAVIAPDFRSAAVPSSAFYAFVEAFLADFPAKKPILMFDEYELIETKIENGVLTEDVLLVLSSLIERFAFFLVFTGSRDIDQRQRKYWSILGKSLYRTVSYLREEDALRLIKDPVQGRLRYEHDVPNAIYRLTSGQAFYTQAICQALVDHANGTQANVATSSALKNVTTEIIENPFPQMIFLWDGFGAEEKAVLSILAEVLTDSKSDADVSAIQAAIRSNRYPIRLSRGQIAQILEKLFKAEFLQKSVSGTRFAFRMDLWRLWVRRMHSVWQVLREEHEGMPRGGAPAGSRDARLAVALIAALGVAGLGFWSWNSRRSGTRDAAPSEAIGRSAQVSLVTEPRTRVTLRGEALVPIDSLSVGSGTTRFLRRADTPGTYDFLVSPASEATGMYRDTTLQISVAQADIDSARTLAHFVRLATRRVSLEVRSVPSGASVSVDGRLRGKSTIVVDGLALAQGHQITVEAPGFETATRMVDLMPDSPNQLTFQLVESSAELLVTSAPDGADVRIDQSEAKLTPFRVGDIPPGPHRLRIAKAGSVPLDTTVTVHGSDRELHFRLRSLRPGVLVVQGARPASIYVDGILVIEGVQNSGDVALAAGGHEIVVVTASGEEISRHLEVEAGQRSVFDFSEDRIVSRAQIER